MKNCLQTVLGFYLKTSVKATGTLPLTSMGPKYYSLIYLTLNQYIYMPEGPICLEFALKTSGTKLEKSTELS